MKTKPVVINIMNHPPAYDLMNYDHKFTYNWTTDCGDYIGFDAIDWPDILVKEILKSSNKYVFEVWQPDFKADRIYSKEINENYIRKLFPTKKYYYDLSFRSRQDNLSDSIIDELIRYSSNKNIIIHLNSLRGILTYKICEIFKDKSTPILITGHGSIMTPKDQRKSITRNPIKKLSLLFEDKLFYSTSKRASFISDENFNQINYLKKALSRNIEYLTLGINFDEWNRNLIDLTKDEEIAKLKTEGKKIFLTVAHLISRKRIDLLIKLFSQISNHNNFCLVIVGNGTEEYKEYLKTLGLELIRKKQLIFRNYTSGDKLKSLYSESDYFITTSKSEGTQVASIFATAMGIPIISTENNGIADILKETSSGLILKDTDF
ncbi:MAG: glycosyltransferase, partial [Ignavibacteria bacterium]